MTAIDDSDGDLIDASMPREGAGLDVFVAELENIVEHKGIGIGNHDEVDDCDNTTDYDDQEVEQYRDDIDGGQDLEEYAALHGQVNGAEHEDCDEERCEQNDGCAEEWTEEAGSADDHAEHADESGYAEWNADENECHDGEDDLRRPLQRERRRHLGST